jgi:hypothetical protein
MSGRGVTVPWAGDVQGKPSLAPVISPSEARMGKRITAEDAEVHRGSPRETGARDGWGVAAHLEADLEIGAKRYREVIASRGRP